jgi:F-type H+-transporting ATPase subunit epsilon
MFHLTLVTAEKTIYEGDIDMLVAPAVDGEIGIMTNHHPLVTKLGPGALRITKPDGSQENLFMSGGYLEVNNNKATILADLVEGLDTIQKEEAAAARKRAEEMLHQASDDVEREKFEQELRYHLIRERLANVSQVRQQRGKEEETSFEDNLP